MSEVKISVIVPVYNSSKALCKCIESVLSQTFPDIELILVDDGSTDGSAEICDSYSKRDSRIVVFHNDNHGVSYSRNFGIENSSGKYIMFLDSDDFVDPQWCRLHYDAIESNPDAWIVSAFRNVGSIEEDVVMNNAQSTIVMDKEKYFDLFKLGITGFPWNHIFLRSKLEGIRFFENVSCGEDVVFNNSYLLGCDKIVVINKPLYMYLRGEGETLSTKYTSKYFDIHRPLYESRKQFITADNMPCFCKVYFSIFTTGLKMTFDRRNKEGFFSKLRYNNSILKNPSFIECMNNADLSAESPKYIKLLRSQSYLRIYVIEKLATLRGKLRK